MMAADDPENTLLVSFHEELTGRQYAALHVECEAIIAEHDGHLPYTEETLQRLSAVVARELPICEPRVRVGGDKTSRTLTLSIAELDAISIERLQMPKRPHSLLLGAIEAKVKRKIATPTKTTQVRIILEWETEIRHLRSILDVQAALEGKGRVRMLGLEQVP